MTGAEPVLPAWSEPFAGPGRAALARPRPFGTMARAEAFGAADGHGLRVAIVDSGVEANHPALGDSLVKSVRVDVDGDEVAILPDDGRDVVGHGTAAAGIVHALAPAAEILSIRVLGPDNRAKGLAFLAALEWAIESGASVVNLSLSSKSEALYADFHALADRAYFSNVLLVSAANNVPGPSWPSLFAAVVSVAAHDLRDPDVWFYNPRPPVEFGAYGLDVDVAWRGGGRMRVTGNSFAAPHIAGIAARIRAAHPGISPFETKAILAATADDPAAPHGDPAAQPA
jgi:subtilisin